jgi:IrrE N-terminal-like domain
LVLADFFACDYRFFISNERLAAFEQTDSLYRMHGAEFSKVDRRSILEFIFLCECEQQLERELDRPIAPFEFIPRGNYFKGQGTEAADALRKHFGYKPNSVPSNVYADFRKLGFHVFRRRLTNSNISGLTIRHPYAGTCILVNYDEDIYRQRFTAAHEAAHGILDRDQDVVVSFGSLNTRTAGRGPGQQLCRSLRSPAFARPSNTREAVERHGGAPVGKSIQDQHSGSRDLPEGSRGDR